MGLSEGYGAALRSEPTPAHNQFVFTELNSRMVCIIQMLGILCRNLQLAEQKHNCYIFLFPGGEPYIGHRQLKEVSLSNVLHA